MKTRRIKVFLGAYINQTNAQNLNCKALAEHLDKTKFEVYALKIAHGNLGDIRIPKVITFNCRYPVKITQYLGYFWGIWKADVAYLPRGNDFELQRFFVRILRTKSFKTVENVIDDESLTTALSALGNINRALANYSFPNRTYSITNFTREYNFRKHGLSTQKKVLPPAVDTQLFGGIYEQKEFLTDLVFISNDMKRKRVSEYIELAKEHPDLTFHIIGRDSNGYLKNLLLSHALGNINYHGPLSHPNMMEVIRNAQIHILTSRSEGFPKGIIECAAAGLPSFVYNNYGASEWINNYVDGLVFDELSQMNQAIIELKSDPKLLKIMSEGAKKLSEKYSVESVTKMYETEITSLYNEH